MNALLSAGLDSAHAIASIPQPAFIAQFQESLGGETQAQMVHDKAQQVNALATTTFVNLHQQLNDVSPRVIGSLDQTAQNAIKSIPNATLEPVRSDWHISRSFSGATHGMPCREWMASSATARAESWSF